MIQPPDTPSEKYIRNLKPNEENDALVARLAMGYRRYGDLITRFDSILDHPVAHKEGWEAEYVRLSDGSLFARSIERRNKYTQKNYDAYAVAKKYGVVTFEYVSGTLPEWFPKGDRFLAVVYGRGYKRTDATGPSEALAICRAVLLAVVRRLRHKK